MIDRLENTVNAQKQIISLQEERCNLQEVNMRQKEEMVSLHQERAELQDQVIARLREELALLNQRLDAMEGLVEIGGYGDRVPSSSVGFPRPTKKSLLKKQRRRHV